MMLRGFPSSQSSMTEATVNAYVTAVQDCSLAAVQRACQSFIRGSVPGHNNDFAPAAPKLAQVAREAESKIGLEHFEEQHRFIEEGSDEWRQLLVLRGKHSLPTFERNGRRGWYFSHQEVEEAAEIALPPPLTEQELGENRKRIRAVLPYDIGDASEDEDMGGSVRPTTPHHTEGE